MYYSVLLIILILHWFLCFFMGIKWGCDGAWNASGSKGMFVGMDGCFFVGVVGLLSA